MIMIFFASSALSLFCFFYYRIKIPKALFLISFVVFMVMFFNGLPFGSRSIHAFGQHYAVGWTERNNGDEKNSWFEWVSIVEKEFDQKISPETSVIELALSKPNKAKEHILYNLNTWWEKYYKIFWFSDFMLVGLIILFLSLFFNYPQKRIFKNQAIDFCFLFLVTLPVIASTILIYPRNHYLLLIWIVCLFSLTIALFKNHTLTKYFLILIFLFFTIFAYLEKDTFFRTRDDYFEKNAKLKSIQQITSIPANILAYENNAGFYIYMPWGSEWVDILEAECFSSMKKFLDEKDIYIIDASKELGSKMRLSFGDEWSCFLKNPARYGFKKYNEWFYVRANKAS